MIGTSQHVRRLISDHVAEFPLDDQPHGVGPELRGQHAVERRRRAAALQMAEHDGAGFSAQPPLDFLGHESCRCRPGEPASGTRACLA